MAFGRNHPGLWILLGIYLIVALTYGFLNPLGEGPDEVANIELIHFISEKGHLPLNYAERQAAGYKSDWPMLLYHAPVGMATGWIDYEELPGLKELDNHFPRRLLVEDDFARFALIHTDDEAFPYQGIVLLWHLARLVATLFSAGTLVVVYFATLTICPGRRNLALGATAVVAAIPDFHFTASVAHEDNVMGLLMALFTLTLLRTWQRPRSRWNYVWLGLWFGLALSAKYSAGLMPLLVMVVLAVAVRRGELGWRAALARLLFFMVITAAIAIWWFVYVEWYFNQVEELGLVAGLLKPVMASGIDVSMRRVASFLTGGTISAPPGTLAPTSVARITLWDWALTLFRPFWYVKWPADAPIMTALSLSFLALCCLAAAGLWRAWQRGDELPWPVLSLLVLQIGLLLPFPLLRFYLTRDLAMAAQGRHILFPAAAAIGLLLTSGVSAWFPPLYRRFVTLGLAGIFLAVSLASFFGYVLPLFPSRLPVRTSASAVENLPNPVNVSFDTTMELVGYEIGEVNPYGALPVTLVWHSLAYAEQDYLVELSLLDDGGRAHSLWLGHPVNGHYPTRAWDPGDVVYDHVWLPTRGLEAEEYRLRLRLRSSLDPVNLPLIEETGFLFPNSHTPSPISNADAPVSDSATVWNAGQPVTDMPVYHYRATIPVTLPKPQSSNPVYLVGPDGTEQTPLIQAGNVQLFLVGAHWLSGSYQLRVGEKDKTAESDPLLRVEVRPRNFYLPPMSTQVHANFGDEIMLLGYDFPRRSVKPGEDLPIALYWQALRPITRHYIVSNHLLSRANLRQWGGTDRIPHYYYSTMLWAPGEVVRDEYLVPVDLSAPPGIYFLDIGLYVELAGQSWHLPLVRDGERLDANSVSISPIKVGGPPPGVTIENPSPQHPRTDNLGNLVTLLGYDLRLDSEALHVTLYWRCEAPLPTDYTTFVHIRDIAGQATGQPGTIVAQMDRPPADGAYPTSVWDPGEIIRDSVQIPIPLQVSPGEYEIIVGLYDFQTGSRLLVLDDNGQPISDYVRLEEEIAIQ